MDRANTEDWVLGDIALKKIPVSSLIKVNLHASDGRTISGFSNLGLELKEGSKTLKQGTDYTLNYPNIILSDSYKDTVNNHTLLTLSLSPSESEKLSGSTAETTIEAARFNISLLAFGKAKIRLSGADKSYIGIYASDGTLAQSRIAEESVTTAGLKAGTYTIIVR